MRVRVLGIRAQVQELGHVRVVDMVRVQVLDMVRVRVLDMVRVQVRVLVVLVLVQMASSGEEGVQLVVLPGPAELPKLVGSLCAARERNLEATCVWMGLAIA